MGGDYIMHFLTLPWKFIFAFIPPTAIADVYPTFVISIIFIGLCTAVIGDIASHLGCFINLKDSVNAIAFVALGTSVPDTFASKTAAIEDETADASVGNVTGSNAVNVFLGIGIAWTMAAIYHAAVGTKGGFQVPPGSLGFSVTIFVIEALLAILILFARRHPTVGGELAGLGVGSALVHKNGTRWSSPLVHTNWQILRTHRVGINPTQCHASRQDFHTTKMWHPNSRISTAILGNPPC